MATSWRPTSTPKTIHLPRRVRPANACGRLEALFERETRRRSVEGVEDKETDKWRFQAEILRAECNFLRMERVVAVKKEAALRSAIESLISGRKKIDGNISIEAFLHELEGKLEGAQTRRRGRSRDEFRSQELKKCGGNFDKKALLLRRRLQEMNVREMMPKQKERGVEEERISVKEIREISASETSSLPEKNRSRNSAESDKSSSRLPDVDILRKKMEGISKGMLKRTKGYDTILSTTPQEEVRWCSGECRAVVERIVEEVRLETEQWGEMQGMLEQVEEEMEDLQCSRDFWERCALQSDHNLKTTNSQLMEWRQRARTSEQRASELQRQVMELQQEVEELKDESNKTSTSSDVPYDPWEEKENEKNDEHKEKEQKEKGKRKENEKHVLFCKNLNENRPTNKIITPQSQRKPLQPLREICNLSTLPRSNASGRKLQNIRL